MPGLILDSSTDTIVLALSNGKWQTFGEAARIGSTLFSLIESFLGAGKKDLAYIACGRGPGSYTGTRAAVAAATGFSLAADIPLVLFPSPLLFLSPGSSAAVLEIKGSEDKYILYYENGIVRETQSCEEPAAQLVTAHPFRFDPETAIPRVSSWAEAKTSAPLTADPRLVYLQQV